ANWGEGGSNSGEPGGRGDIAQLNDATWTDRFFGASPAQKWATAGGDFNSAVSASAPAAVTVGAGIFYQFSGNLAADVQKWLDTPSSQFGWLIKATSESPGSAQRFDSRETLTGIAPSLSIT